MTVSATVATNNVRQAADTLTSARSAARTLVCTVANPRNVARATLDCVTVEAKNARAVAEVLTRLRNTDLPPACTLVAPRSIA